MTNTDHDIKDSQQDSILGKRSTKRPKNYSLTTNDQRQKLLDAISVRGLSVLKVNTEGIYRVGSK